MFTSECQALKRRLARLTLPPFLSQTIITAGLPDHSCLGHRNFPVPVILGPGFNSFLSSVGPRPP